jgi:hypothetical protein
MYRGLQEIIKELSVNGVCLCEGNLEGGLAPLMRTVRVPYWKICHPLQKCYALLIACLHVYFSHTSHRIIISAWWQLPGLWIINWGSAIFKTFKPFKRVCMIQAFIVKKLILTFKNLSTVFPPSLMQNLMHRYCSLCSDILSVAWNVTKHTRLTERCETDWGFQAVYTKAIFQRWDMSQLLIVKLQNLSLSCLITPYVYFEYSQLALLKYFSVSLAIMLLFEASGSYRIESTQKSAKLCLLLFYFNEICWGTQPFIGLSSDASF